MIQPGQSKIVIFDADDTLWENETYFREAESELSCLLADYGTQEEIERELFRIEMQNMPLYGYGVKAFGLSMIETALFVSDNSIQADRIEQIIQIVKRMLDAPVVLLPDVEEVLKTLSAHYRLILATKGDLLDQERKLRKSALEGYFHHIEIMSDKTEKEYAALFHHLDVEPHEVVMIGNSLKSDALPILTLGGYAFHVPFYTTWVHEQIDQPIESSHFIEITQLKEILPYLLPKDTDTL